MLKVRRVIVASSLVYYLLCDRLPRGQHTSVRNLQFGRADSSTYTPRYSQNAARYLAIMALLRAGGKVKSRDPNQLFRSLPDTPTW